MLAQQILNGLTIGSVYVIFALGFTLIFGVQRILNMAHGVVFAWGALLGLYAITYLNLGLFGAVCAAMLGAAVLNVALDWAVFRPLRARDAPEFAGMITSIGGALILEHVAQKVTVARVLRYPFGTFPSDFYMVLGLRINFLQLVTIATALGTFGLLLMYLHKTSFGRQVRAVAARRSTAELLGVNPNGVFLQVFAISGALAGLGGLLIGNAYNSVSYAMGEPYLLTAFVVIVLGGLGSVTGAVVAGYIVGIVHSLSIAYVSSDLRDAIVFGTAFLLLLLRPSGLFGNITAQRKVERQ